jgi:hypothetical protein
MGIYGSSGKTTNPMGGLAVVVGVIGAALSVILWIHYFDPTTTLFGEFSVRITTGDLSDGLPMIAFAFGMIAVIAGIAGGLGGRGSGATVAALLLGIVAISYPVLNWLQVTTGGIGSPV